MVCGSRVVLYGSDLCETVIICEEKLTGLECIPIEDICDTYTARWSSCLVRDEAVCIPCCKGPAVCMSIAKPWPVDSSH